MYAYAHFLGESPEYVLNELIDTVLAREQEFVQRRAGHATSFVPSAKTRQRRNAGPVRRARGTAHQLESFLSLRGMIQKPSKE